MRHGVVLFTSDRGIRPARAARVAEDAGFDSFYVPEHTHIPVRREAPHPRTGTTDLSDDRYLRTLDPWVALSLYQAFLAAKERSYRLLLETGSPKASGVASYASASTTRVSSARSRRMCRT